MQEAYTRTPFLAESMHILSKIRQKHFLEMRFRYNGRSRKDKEMQTRLMAALM
jgi:hypothetical protein